MINDLKHIVSVHQAEEFEWKDGKLLVDVQTANVLVTLHEALGNENKKFMESKLEESLATFQQTVNFAWSKVK